MGEGVSVVGLGFSFSHDGPAVSAPPPWLGEQSDAILRSIGYSDEQVDGLLAGGVVAQRRPG